MPYVTSGRMVKFKFRINLIFIILGKSNEFQFNFFYYTANKYALKSENDIKT